MDLNPAPPVKPKKAAEVNVHMDNAESPRMHMAGRIHSRLKLLDPTSGEIMDVSRDNHLQRALRSQGVDIQQLMPVKKEEFADSSASAELVEVRYASFMRTQHELLDSVLRSRREFKSHAAARQQVRDNLEEATSPLFGVPEVKKEDTEQLLMKEKQHMQRVLDAAYRRIQKNKEMEQENEIRAREKIQENVQFLETLKIKKEESVAHFEKTRYKTELARQAREVKKAEDSAEALERSRQAADRQAARDAKIQRKTAERAELEQLKHMEFSKKEAAKLKAAKAANKQRAREYKQLQQNLENRMARNEETRARKFEEFRENKVAKRTAQRNEIMARQRVRKEQHAQEVQERHAAHMAHAAAVDAKVVNLRKERRSKLKANQEEASVRDEEAEAKRRAYIDADRSQRIEKFSKQIAESELKSAAAMERANAERRFKNEVQALHFASRRVLVTRDEKRAAFLQEQRQREIDRKDEQTRRQRQELADLRERRALQARDFFVQRRKMANEQDKQMQYLRFFGRTTGQLRAGRKHVQNQMMMSQRLHVAQPTIIEQPRAQSARAAPGTPRSGGGGTLDGLIDEDGNLRTADMEDILNTGREWLLSTPRILPTNMSR